MVYLVAIFQVLQGFILVGSVGAFLWTLFKVESSGQVIQEVQWEDWQATLNKGGPEKNLLVKKLWHLTSDDWVARDLGPVTFMLGLILIWVLSVSPLQTALICCGITFISRFSYALFSYVRVVDLLQHPRPVLMLNLGPFGPPLVIFNVLIMNVFLLLSALYTLFGPP